MENSAPLGPGNQTIDFSGQMPWADITLTPWVSWPDERILRGFAFARLRHDKLSRAQRAQPASRRQAGI